CRGWAAAPRSWSRSWRWCRGCWHSTGWPPRPARAMHRGNWDHCLGMTDGSG
ncbi:hypothetical protein Anapl_06895, partial [Anas platyrhynchos]